MWSTRWERASSQLEIGISELSVDPCGQLHGLENRSGSCQSRPKSLNRRSLSWFIEDRRKGNEDLMSVGLAEFRRPRPPLWIPRLAWSPGSQVFEISGARHQALSIWHSSLFFHCFSPRARSIRSFQVQTGVGDFGSTISFSSPITQTPDALGPTREEILGRVTTFRAAAPAELVPEGGSIVLFLTPALVAMAFLRRRCRGSAIRPGRSESRAGA